MRHNPITLEPDPEESEIKEQNGPKQINPKKSMLYPRNGMGKEEVNTSKRYAEYTRG